MTKEKNNQKVDQEPIEAASGQQEVTGDAEEVLSPPEITAEQWTALVEGVKAMAKEKDDLQAANEEMEQKMSRLQADFDNFRKRTRQEKEDTAKYAIGELALALLPVLDNLERALESQGDDSSLKTGVELTYQQFVATLERVGIERIEALNNDFDPNFHEAVLQEEVGEENKGKVIAEIQKGYMLNGRLLRPAMVKVGS